ncbi:MAG: hypothetical protein ACLP36_14360 [Acidimicrobiales bacterium]|jgi:hypothetical protein
MKADDEAAKASRIDGAAVQLDWPGAAQAARDATFERLGSLQPDTDPEPADVGAHGPSSLGLRSIDDEPAALVYDSNLDADLLAAVRGGRNVRQLTFEAGDLALEMELSGTGRLMGQVVPPQAAVVELRHRGGTTALEADELGCFQVAAMPEGPVSFRCRPKRSAAHSIATSWITL